MLCPRTKKHIRSGQEALNFDSGRTTAGEIIYGTQKLLIYLTSSRDVRLYHITHHRNGCREVKRDYGLKSSIIVTNYETNLLHDKKRSDREKANSIKIIVCLWRESVSEARMDVFQPWLLMASNML